MQARIASFDVFDTVITRGVGNPEAIFLLLGNRLHTTGLVNLTPEVFARARSRAELIARSISPSVETDFSTIYSVLQQALSLSNSEIAAIKFEELQLELRMSRAIHSTLGLIKDARATYETIAFVSDMYLGVEVVRRMLENFDLLEYEDVVLVSSDEGVTKHSGGLYEVLWQRVGVNASITHYGDNKHSGITMARRHNIHPEYVPHTTTNRFENILERHRWENGGLSSVFAGASRLARLSVAAPTPREIVLRDLTAGVGAPMLVGFTLWLLVRAKQCGIRRLYFVSSDGQVLLKLAEAIQQKLSTDFDFRYLYGGRQVWRLASSADVPDEDLLDALVIPNTLGSFRMLLERLGIRDRVDQQMAVSVLPEDRWDESLGIQGRIFGERLLKEDSVRTFFRENCQKQLDTLQRYLAQEGMLDGTPSGLVDIGWTGGFRAIFGEGSSEFRSVGTAQFLHRAIGHSGSWSRIRILLRPN